jgi:hypothetical protein
MTPLSKAQRKAMAEHRRNKPKPTKEYLRLQRQLQASAAADAAAMASGVTRLYPWPGHYYKTAGRQWCDCPGGGRQDRLSSRVRPHFNYQLALLVQLVDYVRPALRDYRSMRPTARVMMHRHSGHRLLHSHRAGLLCITAPKGYRASSALLVGVLGFFNQSTVLNVWTANCEGPGLYRIAEPEQLGPGPWPSHSPSAAGTDGWWVDRGEGFVGAVCHGSWLTNRIVEFPESLADSFLTYMREWLFNIRIPGPQ